jgi:hypothetical protein
MDKIVKRFGLAESRKFTTPIEPGFALTVEDFAEEPTESMITEMRSLIGSIGYCATVVRFDTSHAVSVLSRHLARPCTMMILLLLFLQKQSLAFAVYLFGIGTLHTGPGLKKKKSTCDNALTMTSPVHW